MKRGTSAISFADYVKLEPLPLLSTLRGYTRGDFFADSRAGFNGALVAFPQGMAYAVLAGLPIQYGVYCTAIAAIIAPIFSSSRYNVTGPTNATAVMLLSVFLTMPADIPKFAATSIIVLIMGIFLVASAFFQLASLLKFVSRSVIIGYITAAALLIMANQVHHLIGTQMAPAESFFDVVKRTLPTFGQINPAALGLGLGTFALLFLFRKKFPKLPGAALALILASLGAIAVGQFGGTLPLTDPLPQGTWPITAPPAVYNWFFLLLGPAVAVGFLAAMEATMMAKTLAGRSGTTVNSNQELLGLGLANVGCAFLGGMPASGSPTRSALNFESGARTGVASILSGLVCALGAFTLGPFTAYIPKAALAATVIWVAISLIDPRLIRIALNSTRSDAVVLIGTFVLALLTPLDFAIFAGVAISIALFLRKASSPSLVEYSFNEEGVLAELEEKRSNPHISIIHVEGELFFGAADLFREEIRRVCNDPSLKALVLRMRNARHLDATSAMALEELTLFLKSSGRHLLISGATKEVYRILRDTRILETIGRDNFFLGSVRNPNLATRNALKRAQELIGPEKAEVKIFYDPSFSPAKAG